MSTTKNMPQAMMPNIEMARRMLVQLERTKNWRWNINMTTIKMINMVIFCPQDEPMICLKLLLCFTALFPPSYARLMPPAKSRSE